MTQSVIGALRVTLGLDSAQFSAGAKRAQSSAQRLGSTMQKFGAALSVVSAGIVAAFRSQINAADDAAKAAQRIGVSVEALTRLRFAADLSGASAEQLETAIARLSRSMLDGNKAFARIGVSATDATGRLRPTEEVLLDLADAFAAAPDGAEKTATAMELLGRSGTALIPLLNGGSQALRSMMAEADALGVTIRTDTARAAERFNDSLSRIGAAASGVARQITADLAPVMAEIAEAVASVTARFTQMNPQVRSMATVFVTLTAVVGPAALAIGTLVKSMVALRVAAAAVFGPVGVMVAAASVLGAVVVSSAAASEQTDTMSASMRGAVEAASVLGTELGILSGNDLPAATQGVIGLANANLTLARSSFAAAEAELAKAKAIAESLQQQVAVESAFLPGVEPPSEAAYREALERNRVAAEALRAAQAKLEDAVFSGKRVVAEATDETERLSERFDRLAQSARASGGAVRSAGDDVDIAVEAFNPLQTAIGGVSDAFGDFIARGLTDFEAFTQSVLGAFRNMLARMISEAVANQITLRIGASAVGAAGSAIAGAAGSAGGLAGIAGALGPVGLLAGGLLAIGGIFGARRRRRRERAQRAAQEQAAEAQERSGIELEILREQGDTAELRRRELDALRPGNRELAERLFQLQDETRIAEERSALEARIAELQGNTAELRRRELDALDPANRALAERIFGLEDEGRILREREGLEDRLLRAQGNTEELRRRELEALEPANRSLLKQIFALEDYKETIDRLTGSLTGAFDLSALEFGSAFEARLAQVAEARGVESIAGVMARNLVPSGDPQIELLRKQLTTLEGILQYGIPGRA